MEGTREREREIRWDEIKLAEVGNETQLFEAK